MEVNSSTFTDIFNRLLPTFLAIGMTNEEYWWGDNYLPKAFMEADKLKRRRENERLWLQGMYVYEAICDCAPVLNAFSKDHKPRPFAKEPYAITQEDIDEREKRKYEAMKRRMMLKVKNNG